MKTHHLLLGLLCLSMPLFYSCGNDDTPSPVKETNTPSFRLDVACVSRGPVSRASVPTHEYGWSYENAIDNVHIIIYDTPLNSANATSGRVRKVIYLSSDKLTNLTTPNGSDFATEPGSPVTTEWKYFQTDGSPANITGSNNQIVANRYSITVPQAEANSLLDLRAGDYYVIAIANFGADYDGVTAGMSVDALRKLVYTGDLYDTDADANANAAFADCLSNFRMAGVNELKFSIDRNTETISLGTLMVQRLAARIDLSFGKQAREIDGVLHYYNDYDEETEKYIYDCDCTPEGWFRFPIYDETIYQTKLADGETDPDKLNVRITGACFTLKNIKILNAAAGSNVFEHATGTPAYLGNEHWSGGYPTEFVYSYASRTHSDVALTGPSASAEVVINRGLHVGDTSQPFGVYAVLGYVAENTFDNMGNADNKYTGVYLEGSSNIHYHNLSDEASAEGHGTVAAQFRLRHADGALDTTKPMYYGAVRNTVYRIFIRFYSSGDNVLVRYYYYNGELGSMGSGFTQIPYPDANTEVFYEYILEGSESPSND